MVIRIPKTNTPKPYANNNNKKKFIKKGTTNNTTGDNEFATLFSVTGDSKNDDEKWFLDSGCTHHMTKDEDNLVNKEISNVIIDGPDLKKNLVSVSKLCQQSDEPLMLKFLVLLFFLV